MLDRETKFSVKSTDTAGGTGKGKINVTVTVIGLGLIGGSIAHALKKKDFIINGVSSEETIEKARRMLLIDNAFHYKQIPEAMKGAEFVFICTPLLDIGERLPLVMEHAERNAIISDVGSTKSHICSLVNNHKHRGAYFIGGHPMAGSEKGGIENAHPYMFYDATYVLTPLLNTPKKITKKLSALITLLGAKVMILDPELHDSIAASVSHLPQLLAVLLTSHLAYKNNDHYRNLAAGGFRDMTRIASSSFSIWKDIIKTNNQEVKTVLQEFQRDLALLVENIDSDEYLAQIFERAHRERKTIPKYSKGFLKPLFDVRISIMDRPGELAKITNTIYYHGVNIKDIEIVTVREGEGGILRLGFSEKKDASKAAAALKTLGYEVAVMD
jgi:prephenate dehydrogenase